MNKIKNILWDFDGVILDSMEIRDYGFSKIFEYYPKNLVEEFLKYHRLNGGLSRFHKIRYFYENILNEEISEDKIKAFTNKFTIIMKEELANKKYLIQESLKFIKLNHRNYNFHIVSGSENHELNFLCHKLDITEYFISINGSPTPKNDLVKNLLDKEQYKTNETILIGDSVNDYEAAKSNQIEFFGYNNKKLIKLADNYIETFRNMESMI